ncbi:Flagellar basal-body rod protein FlgB [gamma proteobacterium HdN1]|nr:Flagellar basal-body rod protein FlgB [gamma proteobacterium HdN1]
MAINLDKALGVFPQAMELRGRRAEILSNNLANGDTPGFRARDVDFKDVLGGMLGDPSATPSPVTTQSGHVQGLLVPDSIDGLKYRLAAQPSVDGNTVDMQKERTEFVRNTQEFQAALTFLNGKIKSLNMALKGGE